MGKAKRIKVRRWRPEDIPRIVECQRASYPDYQPEALYNERIYGMQLAAFPEGQLLAEQGDRLIGFATSIIVQLDDEAPHYRYDELTGAGTFSTHMPSGDTLYGADIAVHPDYRGRGVAQRLYVARKKLFKRYNLRRMVAYGRLPGYHHLAGQLTPQEYVQQVIDGELDDSALKAHLKAGYEVRRVLMDFFRDRSSLNCATFLEMLNPDFQPEKRRIAAAPLRKPVRRARICAAQFLMRPIRGWDEFAETVEFFVDTADSYHCHFLVLPELFTAQLFYTMPKQLGSREAVRRLAEMTDRYLELFISKAKKHRLHIIGGSHPVLRNGKFYNVAHLFTPSGNVYTQDKLHITPYEREQWNISPGEGVKVFDTPLARIAILICYDVEFPELPRLLAYSGVEILFVPFSTDEKKAYYRVRYTAQARAVENGIYVVISGNAGNLPTIRTYLINYAQSAIFTPSDFAFPLEAIAGEADPNTEAVVITDLDMNSLEMQREVGSVRPYYDRRPDLYELRAKTPFQIIRTE